MTQQDKREWRKLRNQILNQRDPNEMLDVLLALDRMLVEVSMRLQRPSPRPFHDAKAKPAPARCCQTTPAPPSETLSQPVLAFPALRHFQASRYIASPLPQHLR